MADKKISGQLFQALETAWIWFNKDLKSLLNSIPVVFIGRHALCPDGIAKYEPICQRNLNVYKSFSDLLQAESDYHIDFFIRFVYLGSNC